MRLPRIPDLPDLAPRRRLLLLALLATLVVAVVLIVREARFLGGGYGDTDDAMRLVLARQLLNGRGWWDQKELVLQPPVGVYLHWSRLLDGGIALMERVFAWFVSWNDAETATRLVWPLLWIFPAAAATLLVARRLGERAAHRTWTLFIAAVLLVVSLQLYVQFRPGRVDHHDVQMALFLLAFAGAVQQGPKLWGPLMAGIASGLGLAIGLEALVFEAIIGAAIALRFVFAAEEERHLEAYAAGLLASTVLAFGVQTPPWRWGFAACDALAINLVAAIVIASAGLILTARFARGQGPWIRFAALAVAGALAAGAYLGLDRNCIHGPFADVDPRVKPFWLDYVSEVASLPRLFRRKPDEAVAAAVPSILALIAWLWLGRRRQTRADPAWRLSGGLLLATSAAGFTMIRAGGYAHWVAVPLIAAGATDLAWRYRKVGVLAPLGAALLVMPPGVTGVALAAGKAWSSTMASLAHRPAPAKAAPPPADYCFSAFAYGPLKAARPIGLTVGDIDFGPFVLAYTPHVALSAPYHRMNWGILAARSVLAADADATTADGAEARARALGVGYVLECPVHRINADRVGLDANSLQAVLDRDDWPDWLELISAEDAPVRVFRVLPASPFPLDGGKAGTGGDTGSGRGVSRDASATGAPPPSTPPPSTGGGKPR